MAIIQPLITDLHGFDVSRYGLSSARGGKGIWEPHLHSFHQFDATLAGSSWQAVEENLRFDAVPGTGILIPPMVRHGHRTDDWFEVGMFKFTLAPGAWAQLGARPLRFQLSAGALEAVRRAGEATAARALWQEHQAIAALTQCLVEAIRAQPATAAEPPIPGGGGSGAAFQSELGELLEAIERAPFDPWTVADLADRCHLSADHFTKRFRAALQLGPQEYLLRARIRAAAQRLAADPAASVKTVAAAAGYATVHSFSRAFRQVTGVTPAKYRRHPGEL